MTRRNTRWNEGAIAKLRQLATDGAKVADIADEFQTSRGAIYVKASALGISLNKRPQSTSSRETPYPARDITGQRRFTGVGEGTGRQVLLVQHHPAIRLGTTIYGQTVIPAAQAERLLKSGEHNRKIGRIATKGRWAGMPIWTLTLVERETCPSTCQEWVTCYGNNMGRAPRVLDDGYLTYRLRSEIIYLAAINPAGFIVRLHVLGDFFSTEYVQFWREMLAEFPQLHIFGFTARQPADPIGRAALEMMEAFEDQCLIRVSGGGHPELCSEVVDSEDKATGIVCPAEKDAERCCATCGLCWTSTRSITFLRH